MKKTLILSYYFNPCNLTAANRITGWYSHLPKFDIYPIIITRNWTGNEKDQYERLRVSGENEKHIKKSDSEVYYLPYFPNIRDKAFIKGRNSYSNKIISRLLTLINLFAQNICIHFIPYKNILYKAQQILRLDNTITSLIISGNPFEQFFFGYLLKKEFPHIKWIADYRDDWTTNELTKKNSIIWKIINNYNKFFEKKWINKSSLITTVSEQYSKRLSTLHNRKVEVLMNGFNDKIKNIKSVEGDGNFSIVYSGTIYSKQDFSIFFESIKIICQENPNKNIKITFIGAKETVTANLKHHLTHVKFSNLKVYILKRVTWEENIAIMKAADVLFLSSYGVLKGVLASKLFEYIACEVPILLCPSDNDIMENIITSTNTGKPCNTVESSSLFLNELINAEYKYLPDTKVISSFSSKNQSKKLAEIIKSL